MIRIWFYKKKILKNITEPDNSIDSSSFIEVNTEQKEPVEIDQNVTHEELI